uniref:Protein kinase domain-containing protein n=1 Tax=Oryza punctata TaxID=4537 RepID=A0A0E0K029_ORYPU
MPSTISVHYMSLRQSPDRGSDASGPKQSSVSSHGRQRNSSSSICKDFLRKFVDNELLTSSLEDWFSGHSEDCGFKKPAFDVPFDLSELQNFDYAIEGVTFQQLVRMPNALHASTSDIFEATAHLALEDFLHASIKGLWETFWGPDESMPFSVACIHSTSSKFYPAEKAISSGRLDGVCATAFGGVVNVQGDLNKLDFDLNNVYDSAAEWIKKHAQITVSSIDRVWNKLGNANWGDIGTLQVLLAIFHSMIQFCGAPKYSLDELATEHSSRLQSRRSERHLVGRQANTNGLFRFQQQSHSPEIVEVQEEGAVNVKPKEILKLEVGSVVLMEDADWQKGFQINDILTDSEPPIYSATPVEEPTKTHLLYVGSSPSHLEPAWEDMNSWYQVQRQTKVLTLMKQRGISSRYVPQMVASGRVVHPGPCNKPNSSGSCGHPWCSTPILVTSPVGETISNLIRNGLFGVEDALRCCHDCLSALAAASTAGIRHGDIRPENVIRVSNGSRHPYFALIGWGHAILEDRDRPLMNLFFSSTFALQEGKLCAASDAESLIYLLYFCCGGVCPELDSVEGALQWRETSWSRRVIQQKLGDVSAVLKAFADYVDSICGTPYPMDYEIWLRRLRRTINEDHGKEIDTSS